MKSIFSQISKSSLFNHVMRLAIVCVFLSISAAAAGGTWTPTWKPKADFCTGSTGCGSVYVSTTSSTPTAEQWQSSAHQPTFTAAAISNTNVLATSAKTIYWHAKANDGYYFGGWYTQANATTLQSASNKYSQKIELNIAKQDDKTTYYAKFKNLSDLTITMVAPPEGSSYTVTPTGKGAYTIETQNVDFTYEGGFFTKESHLKMTFKIKKYPANQRLYAWRIKENGKTTDHRVAYDITKTEAQNITSTSFAYTFTDNATVEPIFVHNRHATYVVGNDAADFLNESNYYVDLQDALDAAVSHSSHRVTVMATGELDTSEKDEYTVPDGVTLVVPGEQTYRYRVGAITKEDIIEGAGATLKEFVTFTMPSNAVLNVKGNLSVYAVLNSDGKTAPSSYGHIYMRKGAQINIKDGGVANVYGFITGDYNTVTGEYENTKVVAERGATIYEILQVRDWRGGNAAQNMLDNAQKVFPISQYYVQNIETLLEIQPGATENVSVGVAISIVGIVYTDATLATQYEYDNTDTEKKQAGFFLLGEETTLLKYLDKSKDRIVMTLTSKKSTMTKETEKSILSNVHINMSGVNMNSSNYNLPIPTNYDIQLLDKTWLQVKYPTSLLAGATVYVDPTSKVNIDGSAHLFVYDNEQHEVYLNKELDASIPVGWYNYFGTTNSPLMVNTSQIVRPYKREMEWNTTTDANGDGVTDKNGSTTITTKTTVKHWGDLAVNPRDLEAFKAAGKDENTAWFADFKNPFITRDDAKLIIDGEVTGQIYTTKGGASIISNGGGRIKLINQSTSQKVYQGVQYSNNAPSLMEIERTDGNKTVLRHGDNTTLFADVNTTYIYYKTSSEDLGKWKQPEVGVADHRNNVFTVYQPTSKLQDVTCKIVTDIAGFSDFQFAVDFSASSRFKLNGTDLPFDVATSNLTIPLEYTPSNTHNEIYDEEINLIVSYKDIDGNSGSITHPIDLKVTQEYTPQFTVQIGDITYSEDGNYVYPDVVVGQESTPAFLIQPVVDNIAATNYVSWVKTVENPFSIDEVNSYLVFKPTSAGNYNKVLRVCATYNNGTPDNADDDVETCISINLTANGILQNNDLVLKNEKIAVIKANTLDLTFEDLFDGEGNGKPVIFTPVGTANTYATITAVDGKYRIVGVEVNEEVEFSYNQAPTTAMKEATGTLKVEVKPEVKFNWKYLYYGNTFTDPIDTENTGWTLSVKDPTSDCGKLINLVNSAGEWSAIVATPAEPTQEECGVSFIYTQGVNRIEFGPIPVFSDPKILPLCVDDGLSAERTYEAMTIKEQTKNVKFITQSGDNNDYVEFDYTAQGDDERPTWTFEFIGVADQMTFDLSQGGTTGEWLIEDVTLAVPMTLFSGTLKRGTNTIDVDYNTQKIRITYDGMSENVEKVQLKDICISKLNISANMDKMYLPIEILDDNTLKPSSRTVQITYTQDAVGQSIRVVDNSQNIVSSITPDIATLPNTGGKRVVTQEIVITNNSCRTEGDYTLLIGNDFALPIRTHFYPQLLPVISNEWTGQKAEYFYYYLADNPRYATWDDAKHAILLQVPLDGGSRDATFTYKGGPATMSFDVAANITLNRWQQYWVVEESADGEDWNPVTTEDVKPTITVNGNISTIEMPTLKYTSKYVRIVNLEATEMYVSNLKIEGVLAVDVVVPYEGYYVESGVVDVEGKLNFSTGDPYALKVMAVNLTKLKVKLNKPELFDVQLEGNTVNTTGVVLDNTHLSIGTHRVGEVSMNVKWKQVTNIDQAELTFYNVVEDANGNEQEVLMATVKLLGAKDYITISNAKETGVFTGINEELYPNHPFKDEDNDKYKYAYREVDLTNTFDADGIALFDYLVVYTETTADGTNTILPPSKTTGSNAETPYFIYRKAQNPETLEYDRYQFVCDVENANTGEKGKLHTKLDEQGNPLIPHAKLGTTEVLDQGMQYIDIADGERLSVYMTGFCPYASTGYTKDDEGVWIFRGRSTSQLDVYLEDCHIYSRNKTLDGHSYTGKDDPGANIFQEDFARGSGGVLVFECNTPAVDGATPSAFKVNIHTRGTNLLKSNYGCFYQIYGMRAYQVSSPVQIRLTHDTYRFHSTTHLTFDDLWPTELTTKTINGVEVTSYDSIRTNGFISLQKQANNAPSIDMGGPLTEVNFRGGQIELQNAVNVSDKYKTTLAISYRSGIMATSGLAVQMAHGIGTDAATEGTVNIYDGTISVIPMKVDEKDRRYYLMDPKLDANGDTVKVNGEVVRTEWTSCLRCPQKTYVYGGSICMLRACMSPTSIGGAPTDGPDGSSLGRFFYNASDNKYRYNTESGNIPTTEEEIADPMKWLVELTNFPFDDLVGYYSGAKYTYGLQSITPNKDGQVILWLPHGYSGVVAEKDRYYTAWEACMPEITAYLSGEGANAVGGSIGGPVQVDNIEDVDNLLFCQLDDNIYSVISQTEQINNEEVYTYEAPVMVPDGFKMPGLEDMLGDYMRMPPTAVGPQAEHQVLNAGEYAINSKVYFISSVADADIWQTFTAPFDVAKIWVVETFDENQLKKIEPTEEQKEKGIVKRDTILKVQAHHNADFAAFFGVAMALGSEETFEEIYQDYIVWAATEEDKHEGDISTYTKRGKMELIPYDGTNWSDAHFYLYHNTGNWTIDHADDGKFKTKWEYVQKQGEVLLKQGETYSMLFPYCTGCWNEEEEKRSFWDYWSGKFLIFESTQASNTKPHKMRGADYVGASKPADGNWVFPSAEETSNSTEAIVTGNSTFAHMNTQRSDIFIYYPEKLNETFYPTSGDELIYPTTAFLVANPPAKNNMPARGISRTGEIIYGNENTPTGNQGGNIPTVGGGNDLFITSTATGINVAVAQPQQVRVLSSTGAVIFSGMVQNAVDVLLPTAGVYVITGENEVHKILH